MAEHIVSRKVYALVCGVLLILTGTTYGVARVDLGPWNIVLALVIATIKAALVALIFMHLFFSPRRTRMVLYAGLLWLAIMIFMTLGDYLTRGWVR